MQDATSSSWWILSLGLGLGILVLRNWLLLLGLCILFVGAEQLDLSSLQLGGDWLRSRLEQMEGLAVLLCIEFAKVRNENEMSTYGRGRAWRPVAHANTRTS